jgi:hypothetical protein
MISGLYMISPTRPYPSLHFHLPFAGFLVAEIFSRYYAKDIHMHSYDNGNAAKSKKDNWTQLLKIFRRLGLAEIISEEESHWIASLEEGSAATFLCRAYETLTQRKLSYQVKQPTVGKTAGYLKDISLTKVRKAIQHNDLKDGYDLQKASKLLSVVVETHEVGLQEERFSDPERFAVKGSLNQGSESMTSRSRLTNMNDMPQVGVGGIELHKRRLFICLLMSFYHESLPKSGLSTLHTSGFSFKTLYFISFGLSGTRQGDKCPTAGPKRYPPARF